MDGSSTNLSFQDNQTATERTALDKPICLLCCNAMDTIHMSHVSCTLMPCQHHQLCTVCASKVDKCPFCRELIKSRMSLTTHSVSSHAVDTELSDDSSLDLSNGKRWQTTVLIWLILIPSVLIAFHHAWPAWEIEKIICCFLMSGLIMCFVPWAVGRYFDWRSRRIDESGEVNWI